MQLSAQCQPFTAIPPQKKIEYEKPVREKIIGEKIEKKIVFVVFLYLFLRMYSVYYMQGGL